MISVESAVSSDYGILRSKINAIKSKTNSVLSLLDENNASFDSSTIVPNCESIIINDNMENLLL